MAAGVAGCWPPAWRRPAQQQQQQQIPQGWFKACTKQEDVDICNVQNIVSASTGQVVTGISLLELKGKINRKVFQVTVPTGRLVPPGIGLQIDGGKAQKLDYRALLPGSLHRRSAALRPARRLLQEGLGTDADLGQFAEPAEPDQGFAAGLHRRLRRPGAASSPTSRTGRRSCRNSWPRTTRTSPRSSRKSRTRRRPPTDRSRTRLSRKSGARAPLFCCASSRPPAQCRARSFGA